MTHLHTCLQARRLRTQPEVPRAGERAVLAFTLTDGSGEPIEDLMTHHARKLHVVVLSEDMHVLGHIHPHDFGEPIEGGEAKVFFTFPRPGRYLIAADFMTSEGPQAEQFTLEVADSHEAPDYEEDAAASAGIALATLEEDDRYTDPIVMSGEGEAAGYDVSLEKPERIEAGEAVPLTYRFTKDGAPVTDLRPYLDAPLHLAVVSEDLSQFLHEHGSVPDDAHAAQHEGSDRHAHGEDDGHHASGHGSHHEYHGPAEFGPEITARFRFPEPETYYLFGQAAHGDRLLTTRIPVEVQ